MATPNPNDYAVREDADVANADLDQEEFTFRGSRLYESDAQRIAEETVESIRQDAPLLEQIRRHRDARP